MTSLRGFDKCKQSLYTDCIPVFDSTNRGGKDLSKARTRERGGSQRRSVLATDCDPIKVCRQTIVQSAQLEQLDVRG